MSPGPLALCCSVTPQSPGSDVIADLTIAALWQQGGLPVLRSVARGAAAAVTQASPLTPSHGLPGLPYSTTAPKAGRACCRKSSCFSQQEPEPGSRRQLAEQWKGRQGTRAGCLCWLWLGGFLLFAVALTVLRFVVLMNHHPDWGLGSCPVRAAAKRAVGAHAEACLNSAQNQVLGNLLQSQHAPKQKRGCSHTAVDRTVSPCSL